VVSAGTFGARAVVATPKSRSGGVGTSRTADAY
jgi:hypothetical protein